MMNSILPPPTKRKREDEETEANAAPVAKSQRVASVGDQQQPQQVAAAPEDTQTLPALRRTSFGVSVNTTNYAARD